MAAKKQVPAKKKRNRKPGPQSTDGMKLKKAYKPVNKKKGKSKFLVEEGSMEYKILDRGGLEKLFRTPQDLLNAALKYFQWVTDNPWYKHEWKSDVGMVKIPVGRPMTIKGMCVHMGANSEYYRNFKNGLTEEDRVSYGSVISFIDETIYSQKFEGAAIGAFSATIISRDLGLADTLKVEDNRKEVADVFPLDDKK